MFGHREAGGEERPGLHWRFHHQSIPGVSLFHLSLDPSSNSLKGDKGPGKGDVDNIESLQVLVGYSKELVPSVDADEFFESRSLGEKFG